jgi:hypothetical protein
MGTECTCNSCGVWTFVGSTRGILPSSAKRGSEGFSSLYQRENLSLQGVRKEFDTAQSLHPWMRLLFTHICVDMSQGGTVSDAEYKTDMDGAHRLVGKDFRQMEAKC